MKVEINLLPLYACALAYVDHIKHDLDTEYAKNLVEYYRAAKECEYYDSLFAKELSLPTEEAYKKALGILAYSSEHPEDDLSGSSLDLLFKKGYRKLYNVFNKLPKDKKLHFDSVVGSEIHTKLTTSSGLVTDDQMNGTLFASYYFARAWDRSLVCDDEQLNNILAYIMHYGYSTDCRLPSDLNRYNETFRKEVQAYLKQIPKNVFTKIQLAPKDQESGYTLPFDVEQLCSVSILGSMRFGKEDIEKLAIAYTYGISKGVTEDLSTYLKYAPYILGMCKAYRQVKEYYFENNQENVITEIESVKDELNQTRSKLVAAEEQRVIEQRNSRKQIQHLTEELEKKQKEIQLLQAQLEKQATDKQELHALREYIFSLGESGDAEDWSESDKLSTEQIGELNQISGTIVGGHPIWVKKIKAQLSSWQYISVGDETTVRNAALRKTDLVCFVTAHLSHTLYYAMVSKSQDWGAQIGYINRTNVNMALCELWDLTHREK